MGIKVHVSGPVFDGRAILAVDDFLDEATMDVGQQGMSEVHELLDLSIRNPTPYYETQIMVERQFGDVVVHDQDVIYGPWLEGVSERNRETRFKGYASFRRATQALERKAGALAQRVLPKHLRRMN